MNKRRRELLAALTPAVEFAQKRAGEPKNVPGFTVRPRAAADTAAELVIYGRIGGGGWFDEGISAAHVGNALRDAGPGPVNVRLNSGGGDVFDGVAIHSLLARHPGTVTVYVDGLAASAASFIMLAGDRIVAARNAFVMIHDGMTMTYGNADTHQRAVELLAKVSDNIADMYAERAGEDTAYWRDLMTVNGEDGTWYTGQEALTAGLVDEITEPADPDEEDAAVAARLSGHDRLPEKVTVFVAAHLAGGGYAVTDDDASVILDLVGERGPEMVDENFRFAMQMAHWRMTHGKTTASNGQREKA